jgi:outer membrane protein TolC
MSASTAPTTAVSFPLLPFGAALLFASACRAAAPRADAEASIAGALALPGAVVFRTEGAVDLGTPAEALTLADALRRAVETSSELLEALARVRAAEAEAELAGLFPNPILDLALRFPEGGGRLDVEGSLGADLLAILERPRRSRAAGHRLEAAAADALSTALDVVAETRGLYARVQALEELVPLLGARADVLERLRGVAEARLELGLGTRHEVSAIDAERLEAALELSERRRELASARISLAARIGEPSGSASWTLDAWQGPPRLVAGESAWIETALRARPELLAIEWELRARGEEVELAGLGSWEGLGVGLDGESEDGEHSIGPLVSAPLRAFDRGAARGRRAAALEAETRHRLTTARRAVIEEVRTSLAALRGAQEDLERVVGELLPLAERRRSEVEESFRAGFDDATAVLLAEQALQEAHALRIGLEREVSDGLLRLERAVGGPCAFEASLASAGGRKP